ncbi:CaiB/BaiF CoA transferase family protein [Sphingosinicella microcystinivorans]|uniref:CaiB/BaiF CoA transferase family protein n=1 Tax=Sphingosinicella microcystinivorans TaxID=335406 RepID=UPI0022F3C780|nr:CoA transferase [Sphingosinicella microcystinivorans]WBX83769.1 CoA transferase [Sphingosinicella microcystinivorans]
MTRPSSAKRDSARDAIPSGVAGALQGVRVLDLTSVIMGPYATQILADNGADVIFVEHPFGKGTRELGAADYSEFSGISLNLLRNKRSLCIDLKRPEGRGALLRLAAGCDAIVTNLRPAPLARLGLDYGDFVAVNPEIIFCQAVGFPSDTDRADDPAYDDIIQSECGLAEAYQRVTGSPQLCPTIVADKVCGLFIANAITTALHFKQRTGRGQRVEIPMIDVMRAFMMVEHGAGGVADPERGDAGYMRVLNTERGPQRTSDGWIMILPYGPDAYDAIFEIGGRADMVRNERTRGRGPMIHAEYLYAQLRPIIAKRTTAEWLAFCRRKNIPVGTVERLNDVVHQYPVVEHPVFGAYRTVPPPVRYSASPAAVRQPAPMLGQDTDELLREAGLEDAALEALESSGVIRRRRFERKVSVRHEG